MAGTVTVEEVLANANGNTGRIRLVIDAMLRALQTNLPAVLAHCGLPAINGYFWAGEIIGEDNFPAISVAGSTTKEAHGTGYTNRTHLVCACVFPLPISRRDWQVSADVADLITAVMFCPTFRGPYCEAEADPHAWHALIPRGPQPLPPSPDRDYGGMAAHFEAVQHAAGPNTNPYWS